MMCGLGQEFRLLSFYKFDIIIFYKKVIVKGFLMALSHLKETDIETYCKTIKQVNCTVVNFNSM